MEETTDMEETSQSTTRVIQARAKVDIEKVDTTTRMSKTMINNSIQTTMIMKSKNSIRRTRLQ